MYGVSGDADGEGTADSEHGMGGVAVTDIVVDIMWCGMDTTEIGYQPIRDIAWSNSMFFLVFIMVGYYFCLNIFLGVIFDHFSTVKAEQGGPVFATEKQREWADAASNVLTMKLPYIVPPPPNDRPGRLQARRRCSAVWPCLFWMVISALLRI